MPAYLTMAGASLVPLRAAQLFEGALPSKMFEAMACGAPVILSARGEAAAVLEEAGAGLVVPPEDPAALVAAIRYLKDHPAEAAALGKKGGYLWCGPTRGPSRRGGWRLCCGRWPGAEGRPARLRHLK